MNETTTEVKIIPAKNLSDKDMDALREQIKKNYNSSVEVKSVTFHFKKQKDKKTGLESKRESLILPIPVPNVEGLLEVQKAGGNQLDLLLSAMEDTIIAQARAIINDDDECKLTAENFPVENLSWEYIANLPPTTRKGGGIPVETWEEFAADYMEVMPEATGRTLEQVEKAADIIKRKFATIKNHPDKEKIITFILEQLAVYVEATPNFEDYEDCVAHLNKRADVLLKDEPADLMSAL